MVRGAAQTIPAKTRPGAAASAPRPGPGVGLSGNDVNNTLRRLAFRLGLAVVFLRFSLLQALLTGAIHMNLRLLYIVGLPALAGVVLSGGLRRSFQGRLAWYWVGYAAWMAAAVPFSSWRGGSASLVSGFLRTEFPVMLIIAGLAMTWRECRSLLRTVALAAVVSVVAMPVFERDFGGRSGLEFGTVADPNDYAVHLLLVLPFLLWVGSNAKLALVRFGAIGGVALGMAMVLKTASRGAAVALAVAILFFLFRAPMRQRIALVLLAPVAAAILFAAVPRAAIDRISSLAHAGTAADTEYGSTMARSYLFWKSVEFTAKHPVFGVGPGMFADYEGRTSRAEARRGSWHDTHNTYTQISSECGIPALLFYLAGIVASFRRVNSIHREARRRADCGDIQSAAFCIMLAMVGYCAATMFLNFAYFFYLPAMGGICIVLVRAAREEMRTRPGANETNTGRNACATRGIQPQARPSF